MEMVFSSLSLFFYLKISCMLLLAERGFSVLFPSSFLIAGKTLVPVSMKLHLLAGTCIPPSPCTPADDIAGRADAPLSSVLGLFQLPNVRHAPWAAATESRAGGHLPT